MRFYGIGEVARLLRVRPHVIRYWVTEAPFLSPRKSGGGRREYSSRDVQLLMRFQFLLHEKRYTVEGARRRIWEELAGGAPDALSRVAQVRSDLIEILAQVQKRRVNPLSESAVRESFEAIGQGHLFRFWEGRPAAMREKLLADLGRLDPELVARLAARAADRDPPLLPFTPAPCLRLQDTRQDAEARALGESLIRGGRTAFLTVAGGQGSRLGFDGPKGLFAVSPIRKATLFRLFAEKLLAARRRYGVEIPWLIMTSPLNQARTLEYFEAEGWFGLGRDTVSCFPQGTLPSLSPDGLLLLAEDGGIFENPNGHGGVIEGLRESGLLDRMRSLGVEELSYFQVDNPLVDVPDPVFLGCHRRAGADISSKTVRKAYPEEKLGTIAVADGKPFVVEYSDLPKELMTASAADGGLLYPQGSIAIHAFNVEFLAGRRVDLPYHRARKKVKTLIPLEQGAETQERDAVKFEMFVFDAIPLAEKSVFFETAREEEFAPLKNREGADSIATCIRGQVEKHARWLEACGVEVPRGADGVSRWLIEISPLFAADLDGLRARRFELPGRIEADTLLA